MNSYHRADCVSFFVTVNWRAHFMSAASLRRQASITHAEKLPEPLCSRAILICSIMWLGKRMLRVVVLLVLFFDDIVFFHIHCCVLYCPKMFLLKFDADQLMHYQRMNTLFVLFHGELVGWDNFYLIDNYYHFRVLSGDPTCYGAATSRVVAIYENFPV